MASGSEDHATYVSYSSSDDECLSAVKRKAENNLKNEKKFKYEEDSDEEDPIMAGVLVTVEVKEMDDAECPLEFNGPTRKEKSKTSKKKKSKKSKSQTKKSRISRCMECNSIFDSANALRKHSLEHQVKTRHKCETCNRYFKKAFSLRMHMKIHSENKLEGCPLCEQKFTHKIGLGRHMSTHDRTEACDECHAKFHLPEQLSSHKKQAHASSKPMTKLQPDVMMINIPKIKNHSDTQSDPDDIKNEMESEDDALCATPFIMTTYTGSVKREDLSHPTQCAIVNKMHKGRSITDVCRLYNLAPEVVNEIWEDREKYSLPKNAGKRAISDMNSMLDAKIVEWFQTQKAKNIQVSGKMLQDVAEAFAKECGYVAFNGSKKWLDRFKARYNITLRGNPPKRDYHNQIECKWKNHFFREQWSDARLSVPDEDIYTADEFGFFYNPSNGRIKKLSGKKYIQGHTKDRLSVFLCANMPGTDKRKLVVCGTEDPLIHSYRNPDTLPVTYIRHSQAHFTTQMFEEYVKYWNRELELKNKKALLVLDRATIHSKLQLSHLKLVFVPWKASNGLVPMKNGVSVRFRDEFRRLLLEEKSMNVLRGIDRNLTCLEALNMFEKAWERTPAEVITKSFVDTGYDVTVPKEFPAIDKPKVYENDEEILCTMLRDYDVESYFTHLGMLDQYLTVDEELVTGQGTNGSVFGGNHKVLNDPISLVGKDDEELLPIATEKPDSVEKEVLVRKSKALQDLDIVRKYLQSTETSYDTFCCFMEIEKFVMQAVLG